MTLHRQGRRVYIPNTPNTPFLHHHITSYITTTTTPYPLTYSFNSTPELKIHSDILPRKSWVRSGISCLFLILFLVLSTSFYADQIFFCCFTPFQCQIQHLYFVYPLKVWFLYTSPIWFTPKLTGNDIFLSYTQWSHNISYCIIDKAAIYKHHNSYHSVGVVEKWCW